MSHVRIHDAAVAKHAAARNPLHESGEKRHDKKGGDGIYHVDDGQVFNAVSFQKCGLCKVIKQDTGCADQEEEQNDRKKQGNLIFVDLKPFPQDFQHQIASVPER